MLNFYRYTGFGIDSDSEAIKNKKTTILSGGNRTRNK